MYKTKENLVAPITNGTFEQRNIQYNFPSQTDFQLGSVKTVNCMGTQILKYLGLSNNSRRKSNHESLCTAYALHCIKLILDVFLNFYLPILLVIYFSRFK